MTDTALAKRLTNPATGELVDLSAPPEDLATVMGTARQMRDDLYAFERIIGRFILEEHMDKGGGWTISAGPYRLTGRSPLPPDEYDQEKLRYALADLVERDLIHEAAAVAAVKTEVTYKPVLGAIKKLLKLGGPVKEAIEGCRVETDQEEYRRSRPVPRVSVDG